jgi:hypothetical protein
MALKFRIKGRRNRGELSQVVDVEWFDDGGAVLRPDLIREAETLEARAAQLRADAKVIPDQFDSETPHDGAGLPLLDHNGHPKHADDTEVERAMNWKRAAIVANLNIANP